MSVLVSSAGRRVALVEIFRAALAETGASGRVVAADASSLAPASDVADVHHLVPRCDHPEFVPVLLDLCRREGIRLIVPTIDPELAVFAAARDRFAAAGVTVAVSGVATVATSTDKRATHRFLVESGLPTVEQRDVEDPQAEPPWAFPFIVKPARGSSSIGVYRVNRQVEFAAAIADGDVVLQRVAPGTEYTVDCLVDTSGSLVSAVPRARLEVRAGEVSKSLTTECPALTQVARDVVDALPDPFGVLNIQMFRDETTQETMIIEINARFGGGYPLSHRAGARYAHWLVETAWGLPHEASLAWTDGLLMLRYDAAVFRESPG